MSKVYTFWEGTMPEYIRLCLNTWHFPFEVIDYKTLCQYTELDIEKLKPFTLPQIADCVRVHVLRDNGGYWLDADTICVTGKLPEANIMGSPVTRAHTIGFLHAEAHSDMFEKWAAFQDDILDREDVPRHWAMMGNNFTDGYVALNPEIKIGDLEPCWPETYMILGDIGRCEKYEEFYFEADYTMDILKPTDMFMLHNSWTPQWFKELSKYDVLNNGCTLSNILRDLQ